MLTDTVVFGKLRITSGDATLLICNIGSWSTRNCEPVDDDGKGNFHQELHELLTSIMDGLDRIVA